MKKHNFYAGPSILPQFTIEKTAEAILNFAGTGLSLLEVSHRSKEFEAVIEKARQMVKELLNVPDGYSVLYLQGGASLQFLMVPYNLMSKKAAYLNTGVWASKAIKEAKFLGEVVEVASSKDKNFNYIPKNFVIPAEVDYFHFTSNNTIYGTEILVDLDSPVPVVCDMSSDIFSRPIDISKYDLIYAGAQKNLGPSGATLVIVKDEALGKTGKPIPSMLDYKIHIENDSMYNTPGCVAVFGCLQTLLWLKEQGGPAAIEKVNKAKADLLYGEIDRNKCFESPVPDPADRSRMNVVWVMSPQYRELEKAFLDFATAQGMIGLKGHRSVGGFRASLYNAMSLESVQALVDVMKAFAKNN